MGMTCGGVLGAPDDCEDIEGSEILQGHFVVSDSVSSPSVTSQAVWTHTTAR